MCRVFYCAQDSKGLQVLARARKDCARVFWTMLSLSLSSQQRWTSPLILWGQKHAKGFFLKGPESGKSSAVKISPQIMPGSQFMHFWKSCLASLKPVKPFVPFVVLRVQEESFLLPPIPSAQVKTNQQNQWQTEQHNPHPFHNFPNHSPSNTIKSEGCEIPDEPQLLSLALHWDCRSAYCSCNTAATSDCPTFHAGQCTNTWGKEKNGEK